jgi:hypothetical protein
MNNNIRLFKVNCILLMYFSKQISLKRKLSFSSKGRPELFTNLGCFFYVNKYFRYSRHTLRKNKLCKCIFIWVYSTIVKVIYSFLSFLLPKSPFMIPVKHPKIKRKRNVQSLHPFINKSEWKEQRLREHISPFMILHWLFTHNVCCLQKRSTSYTTQSFLMIKLS